MMVDTPQHNGVTEWMNQTLIETARALLMDARLPHSYWYDAVEYAACLHNIMPTHSLDQNLMPEEAWSGNKPNVSLIRVFGCKAFIHIPDKQRKKLNAKSLTCHLIGYARQCCAYHLVHRPSGHIIESRDVIFDEGGEIKHYECIIIDHDTDAVDEGGEIIMTTVPKLSTGDVSPQAAPPDVPKVRAQQTPTPTSS